MKATRLAVSLITVLILTFTLVSCGGGGGGSADDSGTGGGTTNTATKAEITQAVLAANGMAASVINSLDEIFRDLTVNFECSNFSASLTSRFSINGSPHTAFASGQATLYSGSSSLTCNDIFFSDSLRIDSATVSGSGYIHGAEVSSDFQGTFNITGNYGYLASITPSDIVVSDYFFINGPGQLTENSLHGVQYPDVFATASNVKVDVAEGIDLLDSILSGSTVAFGNVAAIIKDGHIYAQTPNCSSIDIHFTGTNVIQVSTPCISPGQFAVNLNTGAVID